MDNRDFRFTIPPVLLVFYIASASTLHNGTNWPYVPKGIVIAIIRFFDTGTTQTQHFIAAIFASGVILVSAGMVISTLTHVLLWCLGDHRGPKDKHGFCTIVFDEEQATEFLRLPSNMRQLGWTRWNVVLHGSNIFFHGYCKDGIRGFLDRRWNTFIVYANCIGAGIIAIPLCVVAFSRYSLTDALGERWCIEWCAIVLLLSAAFAVLGWKARQDIIDVSHLLIIQERHRRERGLEEIEEVPPASA